MPNLLRRVAIIGSARTSFARSNTAYLCSVTSLVNK